VIPRRDADTLDRVSEAQTQIEFAEYSDAELPDLLRVQAVSFLRMLWPDGFTGPNRFRDWTSRPDMYPLHLIYAAGEQLVAHVEIVSTTVTVNRQQYRILSPTAVLTYPSFCGEGWSSRLNRAAVLRIDCGDADIGVLTCSLDLVDFYTKAGWAHAEDTTIVAGPDDATWVSDDVLLTRSIGKRSSHVLHELRQHPLRIADEW